jgi:uroporphyrinogen III methyltransferase/synthase
MKNKLPVIYYMSIRAMEPIAQQMIEDGRSPDTPAAVIYNAGGEDEQIFKTTLRFLPDHAQKHCLKQPGLIMVGETTAYGYRTDLGALEGRKILLTCSEAIQQKAADQVRDFGGHPIQYPLIRLKPRRNDPLRVEGVDWLVITSPSSVRAFMQLVKDQNMGYRTIPKIMVCGRGTAAEFAEYNIQVDAQPEENFSAEALKKLAHKILKPGDRILRVRSDKAGPDLAESMRELGAEVNDAIIYDNEAIVHDDLPDFNAIFFASASGVESFITQWGFQSLENKTTVVIGKPTALALEKHNLTPDVIAKEATIPGAIQSLATFFITEKLNI